MGSGEDGYRLRFAGAFQFLFHNINGWAKIQRISQETRSSLPAIS
jgi:hypothetical protein